MLNWDWRKADISVVPMPLKKTHLYYLEARAWGPKGYLGGYHPWLSFWSKEYRQWLVAELSDRETISIQNAELLFAGSNEFFRMTPLLSNRIPTQKWFNAKPRIIDQLKANLDVNQVIHSLRRYPFHDYQLLHRNCQTFFSYLVFSLRLGFKVKRKNIGFRSADFWAKQDIFETLQSTSLGKGYG